MKTIIKNVLYIGLPIVLIILGAVLTEMGEGGPINGLMVLVGAIALTYYAGMMEADRKHNSKPADLSDKKEWANSQIELGKHIGKAWQGKSTDEFNGLSRAGKMPLEQKVQICQQTGNIIPCPDDRKNNEIEYTRSIDDLAGQVLKILGENDKIKNDYTAIKNMVKRIYEEGAWSEQLKADDRLNLLNLAQKWVGFWHSPDEEPNDGREIIVIYKSYPTEVIKRGDYSTGWKTYIKNFKVTAWAYTSSLPSVPTWPTIDKAKEDQADLIAERNGWKEIPTFKETLNTSEGRPITVIKTSSPGVTTDASLLPMCPWCRSRIQPHQLATRYGGQLYHYEHGCAREDLDKKIALSKTAVDASTVGLDWITCAICEQPILDGETTTTADGKPAHIGCKEEV